MNLEEELNSMTKKELYRKAKSLGIKGISKMTKAGLVRFVKFEMEKKNVT